MKTTFTRPETNEEVKIIRTTFRHDQDPLKPEVVLHEGGNPHTEIVDMHQLWKNASQEQRDFLRLFFTKITSKAMNAYLDRYSVSVTDAQIEDEGFVDPVEEDPTP